MILIAFFLIQVGVPENIDRENTICEAQDDQPYRFCLAARRHQRAERDLATALAAAKRSATMQKDQIDRFVRINGEVTLAGNPLRVLDIAQQAWKRSYRLDCQAVGLAFATGNAGTEGVTASQECEADRMFDRARFLNSTYSTER